jgi:hypothetical protein
MWSTPVVLANDRRISEVGDEVGNAHSLLARLGPRRRCSTGGPAHGDASPGMTRVRCGSRMQERAAREGKSARVQDYRCHFLLGAT